jgi:uncharacterized Zn finger protein
MKTPTIQARAIDRQLRDIPCPRCGEEAADLIDVGDPVNYCAACGRIWRTEDDDEEQ